LERKRRGVQLTPAGSALLHHARIVTEQLEQMRGELSGYAKGLRCRIRVLANTVAMTELLPAALAAFLSAHPNVDVELEDRPSREIKRAVAEGLADIGLVTDPIDPNVNLEIMPLGAIPLVVITPNGHSLGHCRSAPFSAILNYDFVGLPAGSALQDYLDHQAARISRRLKVRLRLNAFEPICRMVESGIGIAVVPETAALRFQRSMALRSIALMDSWALRHHAICVRNFKSLPAPAQQLVHCLRTCLDGLHTESKHRALLASSELHTFGLTRPIFASANGSRALANLSSCLLHPFDSDHIANDLEACSRPKPPINEPRRRGWQLKPPWAPARKMRPKTWAPPA
jgi:DNA-binding transcriptional LysR family regulator